MGSLKTDSQNRFATILYGFENYLSEDFAKQQPLHFSEFVQRTSKFSLISNFFRMLFLRYSHYPWATDQVEVIQRTFERLIIKVLFSKLLLLSQLSAFLEITFRTKIQKLYFWFC